MKLLYISQSTVSITRTNPLNSLWGSNRSLFRESRGTHTHTFCGGISGVLIVHVYDTKNIVGLWSLRVYNDPSTAAA